MIDNLNKKNPGLTINGIENNSFTSYGCVVNGLPFDEAGEFMENSQIPQEGNVYVASVSDMEDTELYEIAGKSVYGGMPIQVGYCNGNNSMLNGLEYHKGSEILFAVTGLVLLLGHIWDISDGKYSSSKVEAFFVPSGTAVELYGTTLHFAPCKVSDSGFKSIIVLPKETNCLLTSNHVKALPEDEMLFMINKWLIVHPDAVNLVADNAFVGITGKNLKVSY